ncbi:MAG: deaminase [Firmicutes bacterium]|nr:deaminase [Bacillota bacterium]
MTGKTEFMKIAASEAETSVRSGDGGPFGAAVVKDGKILSLGRNQVVKTGDPTSHAEVMAIRNAVSVFTEEKQPIDFSDADIYSTCEPCPMCLSAICHAGIKQVYCGCTREDARKAGFDDSFIYEIFSGTAEKKQIEINETDNIREFIATEYKINPAQLDSGIEALLIKADRDQRGKVIKAEIAGTGKNGFEDTGDPTSFAAINAIRNLASANRYFDLSAYEMVVIYKPGPLSFSAMHWAKLTKIFCGKTTEPHNGVDPEAVLHTINGTPDSSLLSCEHLGREICLPAFRLWEEKMDRIGY